MDSPHLHAAERGVDAGAAIVLAGIVLAVALYALGLVAVRRRGRRWRTAHTVSFALGATAVAASMWPALAARAHDDLRAHMVQHLLLGMLGPVGLALGAPVTLALRALPRAAARRAVTLLHTPPLRVLAHPVVAMVLNVGGMIALYATPLYATMHTSPALHAVVHVHFVLAGTLFSRSIAGADAAPHAPPRTRLAVLFVSAAAHATLSKAMYAYGWPSGTHHGLDELREAAKIMYYGGDLAELALAVALFARWRWEVSGAPSARRTAG